MASFSGIPVQAFEFYEALAADNSKSFWTAHKGDYDAWEHDHGCPGWSW